MKNLVTILSLVAISCLAHAAISNIKPVEYSKSVGVRYFGFATAESCKEIKGEDYNADDHSCIVEDGTSDRVSIYQNSSGKNLMRVEAVWGTNLNLVDFYGIVVQSNAHSVVAREVELNDNGTINKMVKGGCILTLNFFVGDTANISVGKNCFPGLRISGLKKISK